MAEIELINVSKSWGDFKAVIDFNLTIKNKEFLVGGTFKSSILIEIPAFVAKENPFFFKDSARFVALIIP